MESFYHPKIYISERNLFGEWEKVDARARKENRRLHLDNDAFDKKVYNISALSFDF